MVELEAILPLIGICITGGIVPVVVKKLDLGKAAKNHMADKLEALEEKFHKMEIDIAKLQRNNNTK